MNKESWNAEVIKNGGDFLQSWEWGTFQESLGKKVIRFLDDNLGLAQIIITPLPFNLSWAYVPRGPVFFNKEKAKDLISKITQIVPKSAVFIDFELISGAIGLPEFKTRQPEETLVLDLGRSQEEILGEMHSKTRYNIGLAQKKELVFKELETLGDFFKILKSTSAKQGFKTYGREYFETMNKKIPEKNIKFLGITNNGETIAVGFFYVFGGTAFYLHGGSSYSHRSFMAPYLLHWEAIKYFKNKGVKWYDFWGIDEARWPGVTRFKLGFGGKRKGYPGARVKILKQFWYSLYKLSKRWV